jgi:hypothetical protein
VQFEHGYRLGFTDVNKVECLCVLRGLGRHTSQVTSTLGSQRMGNVLL